METSSWKRPSGELEDADCQSPSKRRRTTTAEPNFVSTAPVPSRTQPAAYQVTNRSTAESMAREELRRSIALTLKHVGFTSATTEALEGFTEIVETYMGGFTDQLQRVAHAARRSDPIPTDYEAALRYHNLALGSLKPHLKNPVPKRLLQPTFYDPVIENTSSLESPPIILSDELDGRYEKEQRAWIPNHFPSFPSIHTYRYTPVTLPSRNTEKKATQRAEAQADARKAEMALRRIDRAAKLTRQKELKEAAQRNPLAKQRHDAWEGLMKNLLAKSGSVNGATEVADYSTIVNADAKYGRKELPRASRRGPPEGVGQG
ncbi:hypothetical protein F4777DRAFT_539212 [Nemania sp. FL0916]|nr:hypothetical protein F4777DRAFT_539212 [Nemania sp. FL0916]